MNLAFLYVYITVAEYEWIINQSFIPLLKTCQVTFVMHQKSLEVSEKPYSSSPD